jgi:hypothetical protein
VERSLRVDSHFTTLTDAQSKPPTSLLACTPIELVDVLVVFGALQKWAAHCRAPLLLCTAYWFVRPTHCHGPAVVFFRLLLSLLLDVIFVRTRTRAAGQTGPCERRSSAESGAGTVVPRSLRR